ncbi:MAG: hypothetical protein J6B95_08410, partial [Oscillospiraceae bacterium]|nr:hypothetical protein [Oscillospiraceae bacterium]
LPRKGLENQIQQSGGLLIAASLMAATPLFCPIGTKCKRVRSGSPERLYPFGMASFFSKLFLKIAARSCFLTTNHIK